MLVHVGDPFPGISGACRWTQQAETLFSRQISASVKDGRRACYWINGVSRLQGRCVGRENNVVLIFISGFVKNQEDEISNFKMSHWKQVVLQNTLKF